MNKDKISELVKNSSELDQESIKDLTELAESLDQSGYGHDLFDVVPEETHDKAKEEPEPEIQKPHKTDEKDRKIMKEVNEFLKEKNISMENFIELLTNTHGFIINYPEGQEPEVKVKPKKSELVSDLEKTASINFEKLANLADRLDSIGSTKEADLVDNFIEKYSKSKQPEKDEVKKSMTAVSLNTRYCPDHIGVTLGRVSENTYQCPLDGQVYNWETGWTDYDGNKHPGGSVAEQTPQTTGYESPHRIFDSRESTLNRIN